MSGEPTAKADTGPVVQSEVQRSSRDLESLKLALQRALAGHIKDGTDHRVDALTGTSSTGMSSETLLFEAHWKGPEGLRMAHLVARVAPDPTDVPVFPDYDMPGQFRTIQQVGELTDVPVPPTWWCEPDPSVIGAPFFVMGRVEGEVPPDFMPYNFGDSWLFNATREQQRRLQESTIGVLARLHAVEKPEHQFAHLVGRFPGDTALRRHVAGSRRWYEFAAHDTGRSDLVEKGFDWLEENWPAHEGPTVLSWGDSRIGNVLYRDFEPVAVLDWEMASLGPAELDIGWMIYLHRMFEDQAATYAFPGMPHFLRPDDVATTYERLSGRSPRDLDWYVTYACLQFAIVVLRTGHRSVHFHERAAPEHPDELIINAPALAALIGA